MTLSRKFSLVLILCLLFSAGCTSTQKKIEQERALRELGKEYYLAGEHTMALRQLLEADRLYSRDHFLQNYLGLVYLAKKRYAESAMHFEKAVRLKPDYAPAKNNLGVVYLNMGKYDAAIPLFKELTGDLLYGTPHFPMANLGYAYYKKKDYKLSERYYLDALDIESNYYVALRGLGRTYTAMGRYDEAIAAYRSAIEAAPEFAEAYYDLGLTYMKVRDYRQARAAFERVVQLAPDTRRGKRSKKYLVKLSKFR